MKKNSECYDCYLQTIYGSHLEIVENAGHMVMMETPDRFNQLLYNFITEQPLDTYILYIKIIYKIIWQSLIAIHEA
jgi:hypothetical protein